MTKIEITIDVTIGADGSAAVTVNKQDGKSKEGEGASLAAKRSGGEEGVYRTQAAALLGRLGGGLESVGEHPQLDDTARGLELLRAAGERDLSDAEIDELLDIQERIDSAVHLKESSGEDEGLGRSAKLLSFLSEEQDVGFEATALSPALRRKIDEVKDPMQLYRLAYVAGIPHPEDWLPEVLPFLRDPNIVHDWFEISGSPASCRARLKELIRIEARNRGPVADALMAMGTTEFPNGFPAESTATNYLGVIGNHQPVVEQYDVRKPKNVAQLEAMMMDAVQGGRGIRLIGGGHSSSRVALPRGRDHMLITLDEFKDASILGLPAGPSASTADLLLRDDVLSKPWAPVRVHGGMRVRTINRALEELIPGRSLSFDQLGSFDCQSIFGAIATGTHGSGSAQGPLADYVLSIELLTHNTVNGVTGPRYYRIEPTGGITDPVAFNQRIQQQGAGDRWALIQDDNLYNAAVVSVGSMGIVFGLILAACDSFVMDESHRIVALEKEWDGIRQQIQSNFDLRSGRQGPYRLPKPERQQRDLTFSPYKVQLGNDPSPILRGLLTTRTPVIGKVATGKFRDVNAALSTSKSAGPSRTLQLINTIMDVTGIGSRVRGARNFQRTAMQTRLRASKTWLPTDGYKVLLLGAGRFSTAKATEVAFPFSATMRAISLLNDNAERLAARRDPIVHTSPVGCRFVRSTRAFLAASYSRKDEIYCYIEVPMLLYSKGIDELVVQAEEIMTSLRGRPHWGQTHSIFDAYDMETIWGEHALHMWLSALRFLDPDGLFDNRVTVEKKFRRYIDENGPAIPEYKAPAGPNA